MEDGPSYDVVNGCPFLSVFFKHVNNFTEPYQGKFVRTTKWRRNRLYRVTVTNNEPTHG